MSALDVRLAALATRIGNYLRDSISPRLTTWVKLAADGPSGTNSNTAVSSGLSFTAVAGKTYIVDLVGGFTAAATTTGISITLNGPNDMVVTGLVVHHATTTQTLTGHEQVADAASPQASSGVRAAATMTPVRGRWIVETPTGGTVTLEYKPEVNSSAVVLKKPSALGYLAI